MGKHHFNKKDPTGPLVIENSREIEVEMDKRTPLPVRVSSPCPGCGVVVTRSYSEDHYMSYPITNRPLKISFSHECNDAETTEWFYKAVLRVSLELAPG